MSTNPLILRPRAVAILVALRKGPRSIRSLADAIADSDIAETRNLLHTLVRGISGDCTGPQLACLLVGGRGERWGLTHDGLGWLQGQGLDASESAKQALYAATDAQAVRQ